jgi:hypothetical protein
VAAETGLVDLEGPLELLQPSFTLSGYTLANDTKKMGRSGCGYLKPNQLVCQLAQFRRQPPASGFAGKKALATALALITPVDTSVATVLVTPWTRDVSVPRPALPRPIAPLVGGRRRCLFTLINVTTCNN